LDARFKQRVTLLNLSNMANYDLRRYNVIILPSGNYQNALAGKTLKNLRTWVEQGGTLIAIEDAAAFLADTARAFVSVRLRSQALKELASYETALKLEESITKKLDSLEIWEPKRKEVEKPSAKEEKARKEDEESLKIENQRMQLFMPRGAMLAVNLDEEHWLCFGAGEKVAATVSTPHIYLSKSPVETPARFADAENLRVSGLLWQEARAGWAKSAYLMREAVGKGQVILFAGEPNFRAYYHATERLLLNAIYYGVGFGTQRNVEW
jgi:hypothetical protein